jgi:hypothetical protein
MMEAEIVMGEHLTLVAGLAALIVILIGIG